MGDRLFGLKRHSAMSVSGAVKSPSLPWWRGSLCMEMRVEVVQVLGPRVGPGVGLRQTRYRHDGHTCADGGVLRCQGGLYPTRETHVHFSRSALHALDTD